jgi:serine/threonine protein kinase
MWSVGVIIYVLLCGYPPFSDDNQSVLFQKIRTGDFKFNEKHWGEISLHAKDLISNLLVVNPCQRWTSKQALASKWLDADDKSFKGAPDLSESVIALKRRKVKLRKLAKGGLWGSNNVEQPPSKSVDAVETLLSQREDDDCATPMVAFSMEDTQRFFV